MVGPGSNDGGDGRWSSPHGPHDQNGSAEGGSRSFSQILESSGLLGGGEADPKKGQSSRLAALDRLRAVTAADAALAEKPAPSADPTQAGVDPGVLAPRPQSVRQQIYGRPPAGGAPFVRPSPLSEIVRRNSRSIVLCALLGGMVGLAVALFAGDSYRAVSQLVLDPRALRLNDPVFAAKPPTDSNLRVLVSRQLRTIRSEPVLQRVVADLNLQADPEFSAANSGIIAGIASTIGNLLGSGAGSQSGETAALARAVSVSRDNSDYILNVEVVTADPAKSAAIADSIAEAYLKLQPSIPRAPGTGGTPDLERQLEELRLDAEAAVRRLQAYETENGTGLGQRVDGLEMRLDQLRAEKDATRNIALAAAQLNADQLLDQPLPEIVRDTPLVNLHAQYQEAKQSADRLTTTLDADDSTRVAAEDNAEALRSEFARQLRVFIATAQLNLRRQIELEQQLASELAILKSEPEVSPDVMMRKRALEQAASAAQQAYERLRDRVPAGGGRTSSDIGTMIPASPVIDTVGPSLPVYAATGMGIGLAGGLAIALFAGVFRTKKPDLAELARPPVMPQGAAPPFEPDSDPNRQAIEDAWADLQPPDQQPEAWQAETPQPPSEALQETPLADTEPDVMDYDAEADAIRAEIRKMREMVEQMQKANRRGSDDGDPPGSA